MRNMIGIMGGRLSDHIHSEIQSFSEKSWKTEFVKAEQIGFEVLEWVFDLHENNPILDNDGVKEILVAVEMAAAVWTWTTSTYY